MAIYRTASFLVRDENIAECREVIRKFVEEMRASEPDTILYVSLQDQVNPNRFFHVYAFKDEAAEAFHGQSEVSRRFSEYLLPVLSGPVAFGDFDVVAST